MLSKIQAFIVAYEKLIRMYKETENQLLISHANSFDESLIQIKQLLADGVDSKLGREIVKGLRQGLRETPESIAREIPEQSEKLIAEFEHKLGRKFSEF